MHRRRPIFANPSGRQLGPERTPPAAPTSAESAADVAVAAETPAEPQRQTTRHPQPSGAGACARCGGVVEPWRESHLCAKCARAGKTESRRRCSRCGESGHRVETCTHPPPGWLGIDEEGVEAVAVPITPIEEYARAQALAEAERALAALRAANHAERRRMLESERALELRKRALADAVLDKAELRPVKVRAVVDHAVGAVRIVRVDTGEVVRERPMTKAEEMARGGCS